MANRRILYASDLSKNWQERQRARQEHPELYPTIKTGLKELDAMMDGGFEFGTFAVIGGEAGAGKSTLLECFAKSFGEQKVNSLFCSGEMGDTGIGTLFFSSYSQVDRSTIKRRGMSIADWQLIEVAGKKIEQLTLAFDFGALTVDDIGEGIVEVEAKTKEPVKAILGDYFNLWREKNFRGNKNDEAAIISQRLNSYKRLQDIERIVCFAAQLSKEAVRSKIVQMTNFYGASQLIWDMDLGLIISNVMDKISANEIILNRKLVSIVKAREGNVGEFEVEYNGATATISDRTEIVQQSGPYWNR